MEETNLPPGFRFHPTDEELITYYLTNKVSDFSFTSKAMVDVDLNKCEPWDLPASKGGLNSNICWCNIDKIRRVIYNSIFLAAKASMGVKEWYFFSLRDRKYPTGLRTNRATEAGYWKTTGKDKEIFSDSQLVGMKKTLVFYRGRAPKGEKTNWVMHEYRLESKLGFRTTKEEWVVCRVFQKSVLMKKPQETPSPQQSLDSPYEHHINELGDIELPNLNSVASWSGTTLSHMSLQNDSKPNANPNININVNWPTTNDLPPLVSWPPPPGLLYPNLSMNSLLLSALQLRSYQQREFIGNNDYSFFPQSITQFGREISSNLVGSSSSVLDNSVQPQPPEQSFNLDSFC